jgi:hypothetical protein
MEPWRGVDSLPSSHREPDPFDACMRLRLQYLVSERKEGISFDAWCVQ